MKMNLEPINLQKNRKKRHKKKNPRMKWGKTKNDDIANASRNKAESFWNKSDNNDE